MSGREEPGVSGQGHRTEHPRQGPWEGSEGPGQLVVGSSGSKRPNSLQGKVKKGGFGRILTESKNHLKSPKGIRMLKSPFGDIQLAEKYREDCREKTQIKETNCKRLFFHPCVHSFIEPRSIQ